MLRIIFVIVVLLMANPALSTELWRQVLADMGKQTTTQGQFEQSKQLKILNKPIRSSGEFAVSQQHGLIWQAKLPVASTLVINGAAIYQVKNGQKRLLTNNAQAAAVAQVLAQLLSGNLEQLLEHFTVNQQNSQRQEWQLILAPKRTDIAKLFSQIEMFGDQQLTEVRLHEPNGTVSSIRFSAVHHAPLTLQQVQLFDEPL